MDNTKNELINKFLEYEEHNETYLSRFLVILGKQVENQRKYVSLFSTYPANSVEFRAEVEKLYSEISPLLEEFKENNNNLISNGEKFIEILNGLRKEIDRLPGDWDEE